MTNQSLQSAIEKARQAQINGPGKGKERQMTDEQERAHDRRIAIMAIRASQLSGGTDELLENIRLVENIIDVGDKQGDFVFVFNHIRQINEIADMVEQIVYGYIRNKRRADQMSRLIEERTADQTRIRADGQ